MNAHQNLPKDSIVAAILVEPETISVLTATQTALPVISQMIHEAKASNTLLQKVICYHCTTWWPQTCPEIFHSFTIRND